METYATTQGMYHYFLDGIRKSFTSTVPPVAWNRIINDAQLVYFDRQISRMDKDQEAMQAIAPFLVHQKEIGSVFTIPIDLYRLKVVEAYLSNPPKGCSEGWKRALPYKHDVYYEDNPFREPGISNVYYYLSEGYVYIVAGGFSATNVRLTYLRKPRDIFFDQINPADKIPDGSDTNPSPYNDGYGSIPTEFGIEQRRELVDTAVRIFLENTMNPRYQSFLQEQVLRGDN